MKQTITIIGSGMMGSALAFPAAENGHDVRLVGTPLDEEIIAACRRTGQHPKFEKPFPQGVRYYRFEQWQEAVAGADFIIGGVSSFGVDWFGEEVLARLDPALPVLSVTKGLVNRPDGSLISYPDYWRNLLADKGIHREICAIGGPCTSYELVWHDHSEVAFCGKDRAVLQRMKEALETDYYHISLTDDVLGLESAVALKNAYALAVAMTVGLVNRRAGAVTPATGVSPSGQAAGGPSFNTQAGADTVLHYNSQAGAFTQAAREMTRLVRLQGGSEDSLCIGLGDLYVTVYGGRTRKIGILLGEGKTYEEAMTLLSGVTLESVVVSRRVAAAIRRRAEQGLVDPADFPLLLHVDDVLERGADAELPWNLFTFNFFNH